MLLRWSLSIGGQEASHTPAPRRYQIRIGCIKGSASGLEERTLRSTAHHGPHSCNNLVAHLAVLHVVAPRDVRGEQRLPSACGPPVPVTRLVGTQFTRSKVKGLPGAQDAGPAVGCVFVLVRGPGARSATWAVFYLGTIYVVLQEGRYLPTALRRKGNS